MYDLGVDMTFIHAGVSVRAAVTAHLPSNYQIAVNIPQRKASVTILPAQVERQLIRVAISPVTFLQIIPSVPVPTRHSQLNELVQVIEGDENAPVRTVAYGMGGQATGIEFAVRGQLSPGNHQSFLKLPICGHSFLEIRARPGVSIPQEYKLEVCYFTKSNEFLNVMLIVQFTMVIVHKKKLFQVL